MSMSRRIAVTAAIMALCACGGAGEGEQAPANAAAAETPVGNPSDLAADAALANEAAAAEAADAAAGGTLNVADVSAANEQAVR